MLALFRFVSPPLHNANAGGNEAQIMALPLAAVKDTSGSTKGYQSFFPCKVKLKAPSILETPGEFQDDKNGKKLLVIAAYRPRYATTGRTTFPVPSTSISR